MLFLQQLNCHYNISIIMLYSSGCVSLDDCALVCLYINEECEAYIYKEYDTFWKVIYDKIRKCKYVTDPFDHSPILNYKYDFYRLSNILEMTEIMTYRKYQRDQYFKLLLLGDLFIRDIFEHLKIILWQSSPESKICL